LREKHTGISPFFLSFIVSMTAETIYKICKHAYTSKDTSKNQFYWNLSSGVTKLYSWISIARTRMARTLLISRTPFLVPQWILHIICHQLLEHHASQTNWNGPFKFELPKFYCIHTAYKYLALFRYPYKNKTKHTVKQKQNKQ